MSPLKSRLLLGLSLVLLVAVCAYAWGMEGRADWSLPCLWRSITGYSCPACGAQRACGALLRGQYAEALSYNYFLPFVGLWSLLLYLLRQWPSGIAAYRTLTARPALVIYALLVVVWTIFRNVYGL